MEQPIQRGNDGSLQSLLFRAGTAGLLGCFLVLTVARRKAERKIGLRAIVNGPSPRDLLPSLADPVRYLSYRRVPVQPANLETEIDEDGTTCHLYQVPGPSFVVHEVQSSDNGARIAVSQKGAAAPMLIKYDVQTIDDPPGTKILMVGKLDAPWYRVNALAKQLEADEQFRLERIVEDYETKPSQA